MKEVWDIGLEDQFPFPSERIETSAPIPPIIESSPIESSPMIFSQPAMGSFAPAVTSSYSRSLGSPIMDALASPIGQKIMYFLLGGAAGAAILSVVQKSAEEDEDEGEEDEEEAEEDEEDEEE